MKRITLDELYAKMENIVELEEELEIARCRSKIDKLNGIKLAKKEEIILQRLGKLLNEESKCLFFAWQDL